MALRNLFVKLTDKQKQAVQKALQHVDQARAELDDAVHALGGIKELANERGKLQVSVDGLAWERRTVANRLAEIESREGRRPHVVGVKQG